MSDSARPERRWRVISSPRHPLTGREVFLGDVPAFAVVEARSQRYEVTPERHLRRIDGPSRVFQLPSMEYLCDA